MNQGAMAGVGDQFGSMPESRGAVIQKSARMIAWAHFDVQKYPRTKMVAPFGGAMRQAQIDEENARMLDRQRQFRIAADVLTDALAEFPEIRAIAMVGSVAKPLWKEVPRFDPCRRARVEIWHECGDLDLALWISSQHRLHDLRRAADGALRHAFESGVGISFAGHQVEYFLFEPDTDLYLGRICAYRECPKSNKMQCLVPGCGAIPFNKRVDGFAPHGDLLAPASYAMLYQAGVGRLRSARDLPQVA